MDAPPLSKDTRNLLRVLEHHRIDLVLDVGANIGQYAKRLRQGGYGGRIVSFEPLTAAHAAVTEAAAGDPGWTIAPRMAIGSGFEPVTLNISANSDMSSVLDWTEEMKDLLDSSAFVGRETAAQARLDSVLDDHARAGDRISLKIDTQGFERPVLDGAAGVMDRIALIQLELSIVEAYAGEPSYLDMIAHLDRLGYRPILFMPGYFNRRTARLIQMDGVFVRKEG
ncbi:MAG TPA: FkbM family methyltransferase [Alphaproteobacteria bacterium]|nr:FkbM family methyltransferase [Alphaproteobacteria bacterium]